MPSIARLWGKVFIMNTFENGKMSIKTYLMTAGRLLWLEEQDLLCDHDRREAFLHLDGWKLLPEKGGVVPTCGRDGHYMETTVYEVEWCLITFKRDCCGCLDVLADVEDESCLPEILQEDDLLKKKLGYPNKPSLLVPECKGCKHPKECGQCELAEQVRLGEYLPPNVREAIKLAEATETTPLMGFRGFTSSEAEEAMKWLPEDADAVKVAGLMVELHEAYASGVNTL